jgi:YggT family protein
MLPAVLITFVDLFVTIFNFILIIRIIMSYFARPENAFYAGLVSITEPVLAPVRKLVPATVGIDWAPFVAFFLLQGIQYLAHALI